jgi:hypothetical protein
METTDEKAKQQISEYFKLIASYRDLVRETNYNNSNGTPNDSIEYLRNKIIENTAKIANNIEAIRFYRNELMNRETNLLLINKPFKGTPHPLKRKPTLSIAISLII